MKTLLSVLILSAFVTMNVFAYVPTLESLLRNGENPSLKKNSLYAKLKITESSVTGDESLVRNNQAIKYYLYNESASKLVQLEYAANSFKKENLFEQKVLSFQSLNRIVKNNEKIEQKLYYSILAMLLNNDGSFLIDFLKSTGFKVKNNRELLNTRKKNLLTRYKNYLKTNPENREENNPLRPKDEEAQKRIKELYNSPLISEDGIVKRFKNGDHFSWVVEQEKLYMSFDHNHHLQELTFEIPAGKFSVIFGRFLLQGAGMEFPETVTFKLPSEREFVLSLVSLKKFSDSSRSFSKRIKANSEQIQKNKISVSNEKSQLTL